MNRQEYADALRAIGHFRAAVINQTNGKYRAECECGYVSATRRTQRDAIGAIEHHRKQALSEARANARVLPRGAAG